MTGKVRRLSYATATHCAKGHDLRIPGVLQIQASGARVCAECRRERDRIAKAKKAAERKHRRDFLLRCKNGHDLQNGKLRTASGRCAICQRENYRRSAATTSRRIVPGNGIGRLEEATTLLDVDHMLERSVRREIAPPWIRHPVPWDNVAGRIAP